MFHNENEIQSLEREITNKKKEVQKIEAKKDKAEEVLRDRKKEQGTTSRELAKIEQEIREVVCFILEKLCLLSMPQSPFSALVTMSYLNFRRLKSIRKGQLLSSRKNELLTSKRS